jgi:hypothetical protein
MAAALLLMSLLTSLMQPQVPIHLSPPARELQTPRRKEA